MSVPASLRHLTGDWTGKGILFRPWTSPSETRYATTASSRVFAGGFLRIEYTWAEGGNPHEGALLLSANGDAVMAVWVDSWHQKDTFLVCAGAADATGAVSVLGSYDAPTGPPWGWRTVIAPLAEGFEIVMYNISPDGEASLAVRNLYDRRT